MKTIKQLLTTIAVLLCSVVANAHDFEVDGIYYNITSEKELTVEVTYKGQSPAYYGPYVGTIKIPAIVTYKEKQYNVTSIGDRAFENCRSLTSITIPNSVTSIGSKAFYDCSSLTSITIPENVTSIRERAFDNCKKLTSITIPENVTSIGNYAFSDCSSLTSITIPENVTSIGKSAFSYCSSLNTIIWNAIYCDDVDHYPLGIDDNNINSLTFGENVIHIPSRFCHGMNKLTSITWNSIKCEDFDFSDTPFYYDNSQYMGDFDIRNKITSFTFGDNVKHIPACLCSGMDKLTYITIPESVTSIGKRAFESCTSLTSITIPNSVNSIGENAFWSCSSLSSVHISNITTWCNIYFYDHESNPLYYAKNLYLNKKLTTNLIIPEGVNSIKKYAFYNCQSIESITIPNSVTSIEDFAFAGCSSLLSITTEATTPPTTSNGSLPYASSIVYIPDNTLSAYKESWGDNYNFICNENSLTINIKTPGTLSDKIYEAWQRPANVAKLTLTGTLNDDDFTLMRETMTSLVEVDLSDITNTSGVNFTKKSNLMKICLPENLSTINNYAFNGCSYIRSITIPNSVTSIGERAFYNCKKLTSITIPESVTSIGENAFENCSNLHNVYISDITSWCNIDFSNYNSNPFWYAKILHLINENLIVINLIIPEGIDSIKDYAFVKNSPASFITIPNSVTSIGNYAFYECSSLNSISIGNNVTSIGNCAFYECSSLNSISIGNNVTSIGVNAFGNCTKLASVTIENSVTSIGNYALSNCSSLNTITCLNFNPPAANDLGADTKKCTLIVPKESYADYLKHEYWGQFLTIKPLDSNIYKKINISINNSSFGSVNITNGYYCINDSITITATPNKGYHFTQWSDGNTDNPRTIVITQDTTFTAEFAQNPTYNVTLYAENGTVSGAGTYSEGDTITITATANKGYKFKEWSDGNTENPRIIVVTEDIELTAIFEEVNTPVENTFDNQIGIYSIDGTLHIEGLESDYQIYTTTGQFIYSGKQTTLTLPRGIYLIVINGKTHKIAL